MSRMHILLYFTRKKGETKKRSGRRKVLRVDFLLGIMKAMGWRRRRVNLVQWCLRSTVALTGIGLLLICLRSIEPSSDISKITTGISSPEEIKEAGTDEMDKVIRHPAQEANSKGCATVEEMGEIFARGFREESLRARLLIHNHFAFNGAARIRALPPEMFCKQGFVLGKASEAGFGNEMYKILTAAALSVMLNRSLIIGQIRHIGGNILLVIIFYIPIFPSP